MAKTITAELTPDTIAAEIRLERQSHPGAFLLVEGHGDARLLKKFIDQAHCSVVVGLGYENVESVMTILISSNFPGIVCVVDADYSRLIGNPRNASNFIVTECHDMECILICSSALQSVLTEQGREERISDLETKEGLSVEEIIKREGQRLGALRLYSQLNSLNLNFNGLNFNFVNVNDMSVDQNELVTLVLARSERSDLSINDVIEEISRLMQQGHPPWDICNGHDCVEILARGLRRALGSLPGSDATGPKIEACMRMAFSEADFRETSIYGDLCAWQAANQPYQIL